MNAKGIVRTVDDLGRVVIPIEFRSHTGIKNGERVEMIATDKGIIVKPYNNREPEFVVHCESCKFFETAEYDGGYTKMVCRLLKRQMKYDDYCSYGELKERESK